MMIGATVLMAGMAGATTITWTGGSGSDVNWSTTANWDVAVPGITDDAIFNNGNPAGDPSTPNNTVDANIQVGSLTYNLADSSHFQNTAIADGVTLVVSNSTTTNVLMVGSGLNLASVNTEASIAGAAGTLVVQAPNGAFNVRQGGLANYGGTAVLDMHALSNAVISSAFFYVAGDGSNGGDFSRDRASGHLAMAQNTIITNYATASANPPGITFGYCNGNGGPSSSIYFGVTNYIYSDSGMAVGLNRCAVTASFLTTGGYAYFRNTTGNGRQAKWEIGDAGLLPYSGNPASGTLDFTGSAIDAMVDQLVVGRSVNDSKGLGSGGTTGILTFDTGVLNVNTAIIGYEMSDSCAKAVGTVNVNGTAQLIVNSSMQLGRFTAADPTNGLSSAILNINGGTVTVNGNITTTTSPLNPNNDSEINLTAGALYVKGSVGSLSIFALASGTTNTFDLGATPNPLSAVCVVSNLSTVAPVYLNVAGTALDLGTVHLFQYGSFSGDISDFVTTVPGSVFGYITNNASTMSIDLVITNTATFSWNGRVGGVDVSDWDIGITSNWKSNNVAVVYLTNNNARFDDSVQGSTTVNINTNIPVPAIIFKNTSKNYTIGGTGQIAGVGGISKNGAGSVLLANTGANTFSGAVTINQGLLQLGGAADRIPTNVVVTLANTNGAILDLNGQNQTLASVSGGGAAGGEIKLGTGFLNFRGASAGSFAGVLSGAGSLTLSNATVNSPASLTLSGNNTFSGGTIIASNGLLVCANPTGSALGTGPIIIRPAINGSVNGTAYGLQFGGGTAGSVGGVSQAQIFNSNTVFFAFGADTTFTNSIVGNGAMVVAMVNNARVTVAGSNDFRGRFQLNQGKVRVMNNYPWGPNSAGAAIVLGNSQADTTKQPTLELGGGVTISRLISDACQGGAHNQPRHFVNISGTNTVTSIVSGISGGTDWTYDSDAGLFSFTGRWTNAFTAAYGQKNTWLRGAGDGEWRGGLNIPVAQGGTNWLYKTGTGKWTLWGTNTYNGPTIISNGTLCINGRHNMPPQPSTDTNVYVKAGAVLAGNGMLIAPPQVVVDGTLCPGPATNVLGTLIISNDLVFNSTANCTILVGDNGAATNSGVRGLKSVAFDGTLNVILAPGRLVGGESFQLFSSASYSGSFATVNLPALEAGLSWDASQLASGLLSVAGTVAGSKTVSVGQSGISGSNFAITGVSTLTNWNYRVLATNDLQAPLATWPVIGSGAFVNGVFSFTDTNTAAAQRFYRLVTP